MSANHVEGACGAGRPGGRRCKRRRRVASPTWASSEGNDALAGNDAPAWAWRPSESTGRDALARSLSEGTDAQPDALASADAPAWRSSENIDVPDALTSAGRALAGRSSESSDVQPGGIGIGKLRCSCQVALRSAHAAAATVHRRGAKDLWAAWGAETNADRNSKEGKGKQLRQMNRLIANEFKCCKRNCNGRTRIAMTMVTMMTSAVDHEDDGDDDDDGDGTTMATTRTMITATLLDCVAALHYFTTTQLHNSTTTLLQHYTTTRLPYYDTALRHYDTTTLPHYYATTRLHCYTTTLLPY